MARASPPRMARHASHGPARPQGPPRGRLGAAQRPPLTGRAGANALSQPARPRDNHTTAAPHGPRRGQRALTAGPAPGQSHSGRPSRAVSRGIRSHSRPGPGTVTQRPPLTDRAGASSPSQPARPRGSHTAAAPHLSPPQKWCEFRSPETQWMSRPGSDPADGSAWETV
ncbi:unnamed protein product [Coccothraustes coccothraustes]